MRGGTVSRLPAAAATRLVGSPGSCYNALRHLAQLAELPQRLPECDRTVMRTSGSISSTAPAPRCAGFAVLMLMAGSADAQQASIIYLGDLPGGLVNGYASGMSADGSVVVGASNSEQGTEAFRWTEETGMIGLGDLPGGAFNSLAAGVSADGVVVAGRGLAGGSDASGIARPFWWTAEDGMRIVPSGLGESSAAAISADGTTIVGTGLDGFSTLGYRWNRFEGGSSILPMPPNQPSFTRLFADAVSADGSIVVGWIYTDSPHAFRWTHEAGTVLLSEVVPTHGVLPQSVAVLISPDARLIYGTQAIGPGPSGPQIMACRWEPDGSITILPARIDIRGSNFDGSIVVGRVGRAVIFDDANGIRMLESVLQDDYGIDLGGRVLAGASGCSLDARMICGGSALDLDAQPFLARVPLPGDTYADISADSRVDVKDAKPFTNCMIGPGASVWGTCRAADLDADGDVDLRDYVHILQSLVADPCPRGDVTGDCMFDELDVAPFLGCFAGPAAPGASAPLPSTCHGADMFADGAIDLRDFAMLQRLFPIDNGEGG